MRRDRYGYLIPSRCQYPGALCCPCDYCTMDPEERPAQKQREAAQQDRLDEQDWTVDAF